MTIRSGLYRGIVRHTRVKPRTLSLRHKCFWFALDIDNLHSLAKNLSIFSYNKNNILSFFDRDHGNGSECGLREQAEAVLTSSGLTEKPDKIILLCMPRVLGYGFNPISLYFCSDAADNLQAIIYEVHNTFGQRHSYVVPVESEDQLIIHTANKAFYVSPFMDMELSYKFKVGVRDNKLLLAISASNDAGPVLFTSLKADQKTLTNQSLLLT